MSGTPAVDQRTDSAPGWGPRERTAAALAECWRSASLDYAVVGGLNEWPERLGRDLDVLVHPRDWRRAVEITRKRLSELGWENAVFDRPWSRMILSFRKVEGLWVGFEVDFLTQLCWGPVTLLEGPGTREKVGVFQVDPWAQFVKETLMKILARRGDRLQGADGRILSSNVHEAVAKGMGRLAGIGVSERFLEALRQGRRADLEREARKLRRGLLLRRATSTPAGTVAEIASWVRRRWMIGLGSRTGLPSLALVGPDGVGKSSTVDQLERIFREDLRLPGVTRRHWRPGLLPALGSLVNGGGSAGSPAGPRPPRRSPGRFTALRVAWYGLDYRVGVPILDRPEALRMNAVLYDRCSLDMAVDPGRYGISPTDRQLDRILRLPRPDLVVCLRDTEARIRARKAELDSREIARQLEMWRRLEEKGQVSCSVEVAGTSREVAEKIAGIYVRHVLSPEDPGGGEAP